MTKPQSLQNVRTMSPLCHHFACPLGKAWHYRRSGIYYLRLRPKGVTKQSVTVSLKTSNRQIAMTISQQIQAILSQFQIDNPEAEWPELAGKLKEQAEAVLVQGVNDSDRVAIAMRHTDVLPLLKDVSGSAGLSVPQARAVIMTARIMKAAEERFLNKDNKELLDIINELTEDTKVPERAPVVSPKDPEEPVPFSFLAKLYLDEQKGNVKESSWDDIRHTCKVLTEALTTESGELNLREHTREDMIRLKADLLKTRKPSTVNKVLTRFSTVMTWAVNNNYLEKSYDKGLKIAKGADSARKAFSVDQVKAIMDYANSLETTSWERWGLTLGAITGARIGEVHQLLKTDIREVDGLTVIDINEDGDGKSIKNKHSRRLVPLIDGAYGFDLKAFKEYVDGCESRLFVNSRYFSKPLNGTIRKVLGLELTGELSYHSLRHSMASLLKSKGVQVEVAQAILGHSSSTITFDHYGAEERLEMAIMVEALRSSFGL